MTPRSLFATLLALAPALAAQSGPSAPVRGPRSAQATPDVVLRSYDLGRLVPLIDEEPWKRPLFVDPLQQIGGAEAVGPKVGRPPAETLVELLTQLLGDDLRQQGRSVALEGEDRLLVVAPAALQERIAKLLEAMARTMQVELLVRAELYTLRGEAVALPATGGLTEEAAARLRSDLAARGARAESHLLRLQPGRSTEVRAEESVPFLGDWEIEIAQGAYIHDPRVLEARTGSRLLLRGVSVAGGTELVLYLRMTSLDGLVERTLELRGLLGSEGKGAAVFEGDPETYQEATLGVAGVACRTFLPDDRTLLVSLESDTGEAGPVQRLLLLRREGGALPAFTALPFEGTSRSVLLVNGERIRPPGLALEDGEVSGYVEDAHPTLTATSETQFPLFLLDLVRNRFSVWRVLGPWIAIVSDPAWDLGPDELRGLVESAGGPAEVSDVTIVAQGAGRDLCTARLPVLAGSTAGVLLGSTRTLLVEREVEVAQFAAAPSPVVEAVFEGLALSASVWPEERGGATVGLRGSVRAFDGAPADRALGGPLGGEVRLLPRSYATFDERLRLSEQGGRPLRALLGEGSPLVLEVRLR